MQNQEKQGQYDSALLERFKAHEKTEFTVTVDDKPLRITGYEGIVYVAKPIPVDTERTLGMGRSQDPLGWHKLSIWVPETAKDKAPVILNIKNAGWMNSALSQERPLVAHDGAYRSDSERDKVGKALSLGYVVVECGTRSRLLTAQDGSQAGKAPAAMVDTKAAIRFLRLIAQQVPCDAERIVITGTSGGGALSSIIAASGNAPEYNAYLQQIGAAGVDENGNATLRDDIFGTIAYCPIIDLGHADLAYAWQYRNTRRLMNQEKPGTWKQGTLDAGQELGDKFPAYVESLGIHLADGSLLTVAKLPGLIEKEMSLEIERRQLACHDVPAFGEDIVIKFENHFTGESRTERFLNDWVRFDADTGKVSFFDYQRFLLFVAKTQELKDDPAFDESGFKRIAPPPGAMWDRGETNLFGDWDVKYCFFTEYAWKNADNAIEGTGERNTGLSWERFIQTDRGQEVLRQVAAVSPFTYLKRSDCTKAPFWYVRHGMRDRDTAFALEIMLSSALRDHPAVEDVNFKFAYMTRHTGDYDVNEAYAWLESVLKQA